MDCPACKNAMIVLELNDVEIDYCTVCRGIWLDAGELELLLENAAKAQDVLRSFRPVTTGKDLRKCPICLKKMEKVYISGDKKTELIDCCPKAHGLWFDGGELGSVLKMGHLNDEGQIPQFLHELFTSDFQ